MLIIIIVAIGKAIETWIVRRCDSMDEIARQLAAGDAFEFSYLCGFPLCQKARSVCAGSISLMVDRRTIHGNISLADGENR
jgi:hypothetical protein